LFSGQYIKKVRPVLENVLPISQKRQCNILRKSQYEKKLKFFFVSESVPVTLIMNIFKKIFFCPFYATFSNIQSNFGHKFFQPTVISPASFELFGRNFGHLATLPLSRMSGEGKQLAGGGRSAEARGWGEWDSTQGERIWSRLGRQKVQRGLLLIIRILWVPGLYFLKSVMSSSLRLICQRLH
jgi:hypothetical protein